MPFRVPISFSGALRVAVPVVSAGLGVRTHLQRFPFEIFSNARARACGCARLGVDGAVRVPNDLFFTSGVDGERRRSHSILRLPESK